MEKSYGIEVAKMLKFPSSIIQDAEKYLALYESEHSGTENSQLRPSEPLTQKENEALALFN